MAARVPVLGRRAWRTVACVAGALALGCDGDRLRPAPTAQAQAPTSRPLDVIFVLVDTLRADHLSLYGYGRQTSPRLDELGRESVVFDNARSQASCTFPSVNSLLTSRSPQLFLERARSSAPGAGAKGAEKGLWAFGLPAELETLPGVLRARGYRTVAISASPIVRNTPSPHNPEGGFGGGFERFDEACLWRPAACVINRANVELAAAATEPDRPFFLYLHLMDPHAPYRPPKPRFSTPYRGVHDFIRAGDPKPIDDRIYRGAGEPGVGVEDVRHLVDLYDDEIVYADEWIGRLLDGLRSSERWSRTIVVVAADHGEEFLEHGSIRHCHTVWDTEIRVPLLIRWPGVSPARRPDAAANLDIAPTLLSMLGAPAISGAEGRDLFAARDPSAPEPTVFAAQAQYLAAVSAERKLVQDLRLGKGWLFDWRGDPLEGVDLGDSAAEAERRRVLRLALRDWVRSVSGSEARGLEAAEEAERALRALGYL